MVNGNIRSLSDSTRKMASFTGHETSSCHGSDDNDYGAKCAFAIVMAKTSLLSDEFIKCKEKNDSIREDQSFQNLHLLQKPNVYVTQFCPLIINFTMQ